MPLPSAKMKIKKDGLIFESNVEAVQYTLTELTRAALRDCGKLLRKKIMGELKKLPGMKRNRRLGKSAQYWVRKKETDLVIGYKHNTWYGAWSELGDRGQPARNIIRRIVTENISDLQTIQSQYLSALNDPSPKVESEDEYKSGDEDE